MVLRIYQFSYQAFFSFFYLEQSLESIVKDILMVIFFSYIGMELRYEFHEGSLSDKRQVVLPLVAAIGWMVVPAVLYLLININYRKTIRVLPFLALPILHLQFVCLT
ncbi:Na+/H+ antiporter NhaA [Candidatus Trichorickettsia mobilis]|uniref:Na+/H+ antiporter NhaA n=1 Tax=Candidatus Trichorickettsia mobilis TaxID=1346319 RepID=UPI003743CBBE